MKQTQIDTTVIECLNACDSLSRYFRLQSHLMDKEEFAEQSAIVANEKHKLVQRCFQANSGSPVVGKWWFERLEVKNDIR